MNRLARKVRGAREARGLSQQALASAHGLSRDKVARIELGHGGELPFIDIARLSLGLDLDLNRILAGHVRRNRVRALARAA